MRMINVNNSLLLTKLLPRILFLSIFLATKNHRKHINEACLLEFLNNIYIIKYPIIILKCQSILIEKMDLGIS